MPHTRDYFTDTVSGRKVSGNYLLEQLLPAPGWRVRTCDFVEGKSYVEEIPVLGFAVITRPVSDDDNYIDRHTTLLCAKILEDCLMNYLVEELGNSCETGVQIIQPGSEADDEDLIESTRDGLEFTLKLYTTDDRWAQREFKIAQSQCHSGVLPSFAAWRNHHVKRVQEKLGIKVSAAA